GKVEELVASLAGETGRKAFEAGKKKFLAEVKAKGCTGLLKVGSIAQLKASVKPTMSCLAAAGKVAFKAAAEAGVRELLDEALPAVAETADHSVASLRKHADALHPRRSAGRGKVEELVASLAGEAGRKAFEAGKKKFLAEVKAKGCTGLLKVGS